MRLYLRLSRFFRMVVAVHLISVFPNSSWGLEYHDGDIKTGPSELRSFVRILKGTPYELTPDEVKAAEQKFWAGQLSHVLRLTEMLNDFIANTEAQTLFANEVRLLKTFRQEAILQIENHDAGKFLADTKFANRGLTYAQGLNWRMLEQGEDDHLPPEKANEAAQLIKSFIHDVNVGEARVVNESFEKLSPNPEFTRVHSLVTEVLDFYDTAMSREDVGTNLKKASAWIEKLEDEGAFQKDSERDIAFRKAVARFVEKWDPLGKPNSYTKPSEFLALPVDDFKKEYKALFERRAIALVENASQRGPRCRRVHFPW